jgi:protein-disulfide isomerase
MAKAMAARRARNRTRLVAGVGGSVIVALIVAIVVVVATSATNGGASNGDASNGDASNGAGASATLVTPANATGNGAIAVGQAAAPVKLEIYLDYMCPFCGRFEKANSADSDRLVGAGRVRLELHPLAFLDEKSNGTKYSTRAANAIATVADRAPASVLAFNAALFAQQPAEGTRGLSDEQIATLAIEAGVPQDVVNAFTDRTFVPWIINSTDAALKAGVNSTPTVKINGTVFKGDLYTAGPLTRALEAARG